MAKDAPSGSFDSPSVAPLLSGSLRMTDVKPRSDAVVVLPRSSLDFPFFLPRSPQLNFEGGIGFELFDDFVVSFQKLSQSHFLAASCEISDLVNIKSEELLDLEDVDPIPEPA
jgi:hypothetical protein